MPSLLRLFALLGFLAGATGPLRAQNDPAGSQRIRDVVYAKHDGVALTLDVVKPARPNGAAVIRVVSGAWRSSNLNQGAGPWPAAGYTTFVVAHGTQPRFNVEEISRDLLRAVRFIRANASAYGIDPAKIGITGSSAGGHLSLTVATRGGPGNAAANDPVDRVSSAVQAAAVFHPPTDFLDWNGENDHAVGGGDLSWLTAAFGPDALVPEGRARLGRALSPFHHIRADQPPVFIVHGDADNVVPLHQARKFQARAAELGAKVELVVRRGATHARWNEFPEDEARMVEWFDLHLLGRAPARAFAYGVSELPSTSPARPAAPPNIVVIFADDLGYGDLGCYGHPAIRTPHLDRLAADGLRFTDFYSAAEVCTPSRAALLTGRYPVRNGMASDSRRVLFPNSKGGLPDAEITLAEALRARGYATAHVGKWHLGLNPGSRPNDQGFDLSFGLPYSNDMDTVPGTPKGAVSLADPPAGAWNVPLLRNGEVVERPVEQTTLTARYAAEAAAFIAANKTKPFFIYLAHTFPHVPLFASPAFKGKSRGGRYGDTVEELDASVGTVVAALRQAGVAERTLVIFTSDNGPWLTQKQQGGSAGGLRDGKGSTWEGGMRVPAIAWWPGKIGPAVSSEPATMLDLFPTAVALAGGALPTDRVYDGRDLAPVLFRQRSRPPEPFFYYRGEQLFAVRLGEWKLHFKTRIGYGAPKAETHEPPLLFHLGRDAGERFDVAAENPEVVAELRAAVAKHNAALVRLPTVID